MRADELFSSTFGCQPEWLVKAPGRVNLIGEHVDYNGGLVLPIAINRSVELAARIDLRRPSQIRIRSERFPELISFTAADLSPSADKPWWTYLAGVAAQFQRITAATNITPVSGIEVAIVSDLPIGSGLSSSAAVAMALTQLLDAMLDTRLTAVEKARLCRAAEHEFAGVPCGLMDPLCIAACMVDHCVRLDCQSENYELLPLDDPEVVILIGDTRINRELASSHYALRRRQCEQAAAALGVSTLRDASLRLLAQKSDHLDAILYRRARHVIGEISRVDDAAESLALKDWGRLGQLMNESHESLRVDFEVSCDELDLMVETAQAMEGVWGSRMTGAGFGGCTVSLVAMRSAEHVRNHLAAEYSRRTGIEPDLFFSRPCAGVQILKRPAI